MSNDSRLWMGRGLLVICAIVDSWAFGKLFSAGGFSPDTSKLKFWFVVFIIVSILNVPAYIYYRKLKAERWTPTKHQDKNQVEVELLAAYAKQEHEKQIVTEKKTDTQPTSEPKDK